MPLDAFVLALTAAVVHAGWNLLTARSPSSVATSAVALPLGALACLPLAVAAWDVDGAVAPYAVASVALEVGYITLLGTAYDRAPLTVVYPAARGLAVVLVLAVSVGLLGVSLPAGAVAGVLAVAAGVVLVPRRARARHRARRRRRGLHRGLHARRPRRARPRRAASVPRAQARPDGADRARDRRGARGAPPARGRGRPERAARRARGLRGVRARARGEIGRASCRERVSIRV